MTRPIDILPDAVTDLITARRWYESQRDGLGDEFAQTLEATRSVIAQCREVYAKVLRDVRHCLVGRFPFGLFYELTAAARVLVVAVFHAARDPDVLARRL